MAQPLKGAQVTQAVPIPIAQPSATTGTEAIREALEFLNDERHDEAIVACERALRADPLCADALYVLGLVSFDLDEPLQAIKLLERATELDDTVQDFAEALAAFHARLGNVNESLYYAKLATALEPHAQLYGLLPERFGSFFENLARGAPDLYRQRAERKLAAGDAKGAVADCETQLGLTPRDAETLRVLSRACLSAGLTTRAIAAGHAVLHAPARAYGIARARDLSTLARALAAAGRHDEADATHRAAIALAPADAELHSAFLSDLAFRAGTPAATLEAAHEAWVKRHLAAQTPRPFDVDALDLDPDRPLRIGYLIGTVHDTDLGRLFAPVLEAHRAGSHEVYVYSDGARTDIATERLIRAADRWTDLNGVDPETAWQILRNDRIDVAIDLTGHGPGARLKTLARKPAPVAVSWLGYPWPTGMAAIDHVLTDTAAWPGDDPAAWRLPHALAYMPPALIPDVGPLPATENGHLTFGVAADLGAVPPGMASLWAGVVDTVPGARLLVCNRRDLDEENVDRVAELLAHTGVRDKIDVINFAENFQSAFDFYHYVDIALGSGAPGEPAELCRALWMGVPTLAVAGEHMAARQGASVLAAAGRPEWIAETPEALAAAAVALAADIDGLAALRTTLRGSVAASGLGDVAGLARSLEDAYREMWRLRCAVQS